MIITEEQMKELYSMCNRKFDDKPDNINILMLPDRPDMIRHLITNSTSFNYLVYADSIVELLPVGYKTNSSYLYGETITHNSGVDDVTIGLVMIDSTMELIMGMVTQMPNLRECILSIELNDKVFEIDRNIFFINHSGDRGVLRSYDKPFVADMILTYFKDFMKQR